MALFYKKRGTEVKKRRNSNKNSELRVPQAIWNSWDKKNAGTSMKLGLMSRQTDILWGEICWMFRRNVKKSTLIASFFLVRNGVSLETPV